MGSSREKPPPGPGAGAAAPHAHAVKSIIVCSRPLLAHVQAVACSGHKLTRRLLPGPQLNIVSEKGPEPRPRTAQAREGGFPATPKLPRLQRRGSCPHPCPDPLSNPTAACFLFDIAMLPDSRQKRPSLHALCRRNAERMPIQDKKCADWAVSRRQGPRDQGIRD